MNQLMIAATNMPTVWGEDLALFGGSKGKAGDAPAAGGGGGAVRDALASYGMAAL